MVDRLDAGSGPATIQIRTGAQPANPATGATGTLLATVTCADPAFGSASTGAATLAGTPLSATAVADGTAGWARFLDSDGNAKWDGSVTATGGGGQITLASVTVSTGLTVQITSGTFTQPAQ
jgi:hypothetical protein